jgi:small nuclear ribonucleoprotein (snRNP)-like protein
MSPPTTGGPLPLALAVGATSFQAPFSSAALAVRVLLHDDQLVRDTFMAFNPAMNPVLRDCVEIHP